MEKIKLGLLIMVLIIGIISGYGGGCKCKKEYTYHAPPYAYVQRYFISISNSEETFREVPTNTSTHKYGTFEELLEKHPYGLPPDMKDLLKTKYHGCGYWFTIYLSEKKDAYCLYAWPEKYDDMESPMTLSGTQAVFFTWWNKQRFLSKKRFLVYYLSTDKFQGKDNSPPVGFAFSGKPFESDVDEKIWKLAE